MSIAPDPYALFAERVAACRRAGTIVDQPLADRFAAELGIASMQMPAQVQAPMIIARSFEETPIGW